METVITVLVLTIIIASAAFYVYKAKKSGKKCIGCPDSSCCSGNCAGCTGCSKGTEN